MGEQKNRLTVNGKTYDSKTGSVIGSSHVSKKSLEGFWRAPAAKSAAVSTMQISLPVKRRQAHPSDSVHHRREHAKTLMRSAVSKPSHAKPAALTTRLEPDTEPLDFVSQPNLKSQLVAKRYHHAEQVSKSSLVSRFRPVSVSGVTKKTEPLHVKVNPAEPIVRHDQSLIVDSLTQTEPTDIFSQALSRANSHQETLARSHKPHKSAKRLGMKRRTVNIGASVLVVLVLGSFIAYQNMAAISLHTADAKAGISAALPGYRPAGFTMNDHVQASAGQIVISFHSNSDSRSFHISQTASDWNSQTLLDNYVASADDHYQQVNQPNGKTVFLYDGSNATWVDGGLWYKIEGNSNLSSGQLLNIANSF